MSKFCAHLIICFITLLINKKILISFFTYQTKNLREVLKSKVTVVLLTDEYYIACVNSEYKLFLHIVNG